MLDNERCDWREVLEAHSHCTTQRMAALPAVLCLNARFVKVNQSVGRGG